MFAIPTSLRQSIVFAFVLFFTTSLHAQQQIVEGRVTSTYDNLPIEGVQIRLAYSPTVSISDANGYFVLEAMENDMVTFHYDSALLDSLIVSGKQFNNIRLHISGRSAHGNDNTLLTSPSAASSNVHRYNLNQGVIAGPEQLIQGRIAGLQTTSASGDPGAFTNSIIRGAGSLYNNQPLIVIDGVPANMNRFSPESENLGFGQTQDRNPLRFINPSDIQNIEVLKDGSAAMYGARGGNGIIFITTRDADYNRKQFEYSSQLTLSTVRKRHNLLDREAFLTKIEEIGGDNTFLDFGHDTDWQDEVLRTSISQKHDMAFSDRYKNGQLRASLGYEDQQGLVKNTSMKRISARLNIQHSFLEDRLTLNARVLFSRVTDENVPITTTQNNLIASMISTNPTVSPMDSDDEYFGIRPTAYLEYTSDETFSNVYWSGLFATYKLSDNFKVHLNTNIDGSASQRENAYSSLLNSEGAQRPGTAMIQQLDVIDTFLEGKLAYDKKLKNGSFNAVLGFSDQRFKNENSSLTGTGFQSTSKNQMIGDLNTSGDLLTSKIPSSFVNFGYDNTTFFASSLETLSVQAYPAPTDVPVSAVVGAQSETNNSIQSMFLKFGYEYLKKYSINAGIRRDASDQFGNKYKAGYFPYATLGWTISEEDFFGERNIYLKTRISYGSAGYANMINSQSDGQYTFSEVRVSNNGNLQYPGVLFLPGNADTRWQTVNQANLGVDFSFGNGVFSGSVDVYNKVTNNMLAYVATAQPSVGSQAFMNTKATVSNKGLELLLNAQLVQQKNTSVSIGFILSYNKNKTSSWPGVLNMAPVYGQGFTGAYTQQLKEGRQLYEYYLRQFSGFDQNGFTLYSNGDVQKSRNESPIPPVTAGFTIDAKYKRFYVSTLLAGQLGHYLYNNTANSFFHMGALANGRNTSTEAAASQESPMNEPGVSSRFLEKASFLRLQELVAGYRFMFSNMGVDQLQISAVAQNLFVITKYSGFDPEVNVSPGSSVNATYGTDYTAYPRPRMFTLRIGVTF